MGKITGQHPKYGNRKVKAFGITFDSRREYERYTRLKEVEEKGLILGLKTHVRFELVPAVTQMEEVSKNGRKKAITRVIQRAVTYTCDFLYQKDGKTVVEDVKISEKMLPKEYRLKEKLMLAVHGITIRRVYRSGEDI